MDNPNQNRNQKRNGNGNGNKPGRNNQLILLLVVAAVVTLLCVSMMSSFLSDGTRTEVPYSDFIQMVKDHKVKEVTIKDDEIVITPVSEYTIGNSGDTPFYYLQTESYERLVEAIRSLDENYRVVLECRYLHELSEKETASVLGLSPKTVNVRTYRARNKLKEVLAQDQGGNR